MKQEEINKTLSSHGLQNFTVKKVNVGFTNQIYEVSDKYILKICSAGNEMHFRNEVRLYEHFQGKLPVPKLITYDDSYSIAPQHFMIYERIDGENLYNIWHQLIDEQRQQIVKQLCGFLKKINDTDINSLPKDIELPPVPSWREVILGQIDGRLKVVKNMGTLTDEGVNAVKKYSAKHAPSLDQQKIALVFWDVHFDNFLIKDERIVGLLDLERTELASIDFVLDTVKRMADHPKKYMSAHTEQFARDEDYVQLLDWYKEFYPELFDFKNLDRRLDLYAIAHDLKDLEGWPHVQQLKDNIGAIVKS